jgi:hypothetical protein
MRISIEGGEFDSGAQRPWHTMIHNEEKKKDRTLKLHPTADESEVARRTRCHIQDRLSETATLFLEVDFTGCITPVARLGYTTSTSITSLRDA